MKYIFRTLFIVGSISLLTACGGASVDSSSPKAMRESVQGILDTLPTEQKAQFTEALIKVYRQSMMKALDGSMSLEDAKKQADDKLDGLNADDVFELAGQSTK